MSTSNGFHKVTTREPCHMAYVIFSMQRSGTTTLCRDMRRLKMNCMFELFNWGKNNAGYKWGNLLNVSDTQAMRSPMQYIDRVMRAENATRQVGNTIPRIHSTQGPTAAQCMSGFKLFPHQAIRPNIAAGLTTTCIIYRLSRSIYHGSVRLRMEETVGVPTHMPSVTAITHDQKE